MFPLPCLINSNPLCGLATTKSPFYNHRFSFSNTACVRVYNMFCLVSEIFTCFLPSSEQPPTTVPSHCCRDFYLPSFAFSLFSLLPSLPFPFLPLLCPSPHLLKGAWQGILQGSSSTPLSPCPDPALLSWCEGSWGPDPGMLSSFLQPDPRRVGTYNQ